MRLQVGGVVLEGLSSVSHIKHFMKLNMTLPKSAKETFLQDLIKFYPDTPGEGQNFDVSWQRRGELRNSAVSAFSQQRTQDSELEWR